MGKFFSIVFTLLSCILILIAILAISEPNSLRQGMYNLIQNGYQRPSYYIHANQNVQLMPTVAHWINMKNCTKYLEEDTFHKEPKLRPIPKSSVTPPSLTENSSIPKIRVKWLNCLKIFKGDIEEISHGEHLNEKYTLRGDRIRSQERSLASLAGKDCNAFLQQRRYIMDSLTEEEAAFPIAFSLIVYRDALQVERLLRAIYRPQNYYCIHIDSNAKKHFRKTIIKITNCFNNVFVTSKSLSIEWGSFSVLEAELICMKELLQWKKWKFFINLTGQEFPLKTNKELVQILKIYNGGNDITGVPFNETKKITQIRLQYVPKSANVAITSVPLVPFNNDNIIFFKGPVHIMASREFVEFVILNETSIELAQWLKTTWIPDETLFATLNFNPQLGVPGAYTGEIYRTRDKGGTKLKNIESVNRYKLWEYGYGETELWDEGEFPCHGIRSHHICILGVADLPGVFNSSRVFVNKLHADYQPLAYDCLEELYFNRTRDDLEEGLRLDLDYYKKLDLVKHHQ